MNASTARGQVPDEIAAALRADIANGVLAAGLQLRQEELAAQYGVSRIPVREALKKLVGEGLVDHDPRKGFFVLPLSSDEMRQLYVARRLLENEVLKTLVWPDELTLEKLKQQLKALAVAARKGDLAEWSRVLRDYHHAIFDLSPDKLLVREVMRLWAQTDRYRALLATAYPMVNAVAYEEHVLEVLAARDRKALLKRFRDDRLRIERALKELLVARGL